MYQPVFSSPTPELYTKAQTEWYWRKAILEEVKRSLPNYNNGNHPHSEFWAGVETVVNIIMKRNELDDIQE